MPQLQKCIFIDIHCRDCSYYTLRVPASDRQIERRCFYCGGVANALNASYGYSSVQLPSATSPTRAASGNSYNYVNRVKGSVWVKRDGSRAKVPKNWGVKRKGQ